MDSDDDIEGGPAPVIADGPKPIETIREDPTPRRPASPAPPPSNARRQWLVAAFLALALGAFYALVRGSQ